jgi:hypothetical protein
MHVRVIQLEDLRRTTPRLAGPSSNAGSPCCHSALQVCAVFGKLHGVGAFRVPLGEMARGMREMGCSAGMSRRKKVGEGTLERIIV